MQEEEDNDLRKTITHFLLENKAYDCLPVNSRVTYFDKTLPLLKASQILRQEALTEGVVFDQEEVAPLWMFSVRDEVSFLLSFIAKCFRASEDESRVFSQSENQAFWAAAERVSLGEYLSGQEWQCFPKKAVGSRLSEIIFKMNSEKVNRIALVEKDSNMVVAVITYLDILKFFVRTMNLEVDEEHSYNLKISISLQRYQQPPAEYVLPGDSLLKAFRLMVVQNKKLFIEVRRDDGSFDHLLFRDDFQEVLASRDLNLLFSPVGKFLQPLRGRANRLLQFKLTDSLNSIVEKLTLSQHCTLVHLDQADRLQTVLGLSQLFCLYI